MAEKTKIQYINSFYTDGSAARKFELVQPRWEQRAELPEIQPKRKAKTVVRVDPLAYASIAVCVVMVVLMVLGTMRLVQIQQQEQALAAYVQTLAAENQSLEYTYRSGYDLEQIRQEALILGMIPAEEAEHITMRVDRLVEDQAPVGIWEGFLAFFSGLLA